MTNTYCPIPWIFQAVRNNGDVRICCQANVTKNQATLVDSSVTDFWVFTTNTTSAVGASLFIKKLDGNIYACGLNNVGQLGVGNTSTQLSFTLCPNLVGKNIEKMYSGFHGTGPTSFAKVSGSNEIYVTGANNQYQQGMGDAVARSSFTLVSFKPRGNIIDIDSEYDSIVGGFTCILTDDGNLYHAGQARWGFTSDFTYRSFFSKVTNTING
jgi:alpha-tubulin suppressor-like RCC1 family protein